MAMMVHIHAMIVDRCLQPSERWRRVTLHAHAHAHVLPSTPTPTCYPPRPRPRPRVTLHAHAHVFPSTLAGVVPRRCDDGPRLCHDC
eukprot:353081-Chlamydomonas_euryale.AAC.1